MKIITFCGVQNSGKTTLIREIITRLNAERKGAAVIVNERGETDYDAAFALSTGAYIQYLRGG